MSIVRSLFDTMPDGREVWLYKIENNNGVSVDIITRGATLQAFNCPDKDGNMGDIICGFDNVLGHINSGTYTGNVIGQVANRIRDSKFSINGIEYNVTKNQDGKLCLHGGGEYSSALWNPIIVDDNALELSYTSPDGAEGFPGNVDVKVLYVLTDHNELEIHYEAVSDKDTILNLTNHAYFNLGTTASGDILDHEIMLNASHYTPTDDDSIPTGEIAPVEGTPFDFREFKAIGKEIEADDYQLTHCLGYDHNFCIDGDQRSFRLVAKVRDAKSGRKLECMSDLPGVQFYTGNYMNGEMGKDGIGLEKRFGFCLETQFYPDAVNHPEFLSNVIKAGEKFKSLTVFKV